jgi:hypothetical protein
MHHYAHGLVGVGLKKKKKKSGAVEHASRNHGSLYEQTVKINWSVFQHHLKTGVHPATAA